ncbi:acetyl-CoA acetyltransferase [Nakamurella lactea]|uniref:acetyl-CoA acetyltransferase n=1 Tax=Nakamurella lactea TaxID=459515 RepID=UPI000421EC76|nr:acetyl-CoA acetyltransferase [Nakamurella lactea]
MRSTRSLRGEAAIVGIAEAASPTGELPARGRTLEAQVIKAALDDAGLTLADVDGVAHADSSLDLAEFLSIAPAFTESTYTGGSGYELYVEKAAAAIATGLAETIVIVYAATPRSDRKQGLGGWVEPAGPRDEFEVPYGLGLMGSYALAADRHMSQYGTTEEQLASIAVATRQWAGFNPMARFTDPLTVDDVLASPRICSPLHQLDCCLVTDGAGAIVVTSTERAKDLRNPVVPVLGAASLHSHNMIHAMPDLTVTPGAITGKRALDHAGVTAGDVGLLMGYDSFTITALLHLEDLGFVPKGEAGAFVADGNTRPGGSLPMNTNGGGLSYTHPGMYGIFLLTEAVRQLRGAAGARQIQDLEIAVAHGSGQFLSAMSTVVLGTEAAL